MTDSKQMLSFDGNAAKRIERAYLTPDIVAQRAEVLTEAEVAPGETVLDIGVGPGLLALDLTETVGSQGRVLGIDMSEAMVEMTRRRCAAQPWASFEVADACDLPFPSESIDCAFSTQVYEYVEDMPGALAELSRVLAPGGRAIILDTDYDSLVLHTENRELTDEVLDAWDAHFVHRDLPRKLSRLLRQAGFELERRTALPLFNTEYHRDTFSYGLLRVMASFAEAQGLAPERSQSWIQEMDRLGAEGDFFFSLNRYLFVARKPGAD